MVMHRQLRWYLVFGFRRNRLAMWIYTLIIRVLIASLWKMSLQVHRFFLKWNMGASELAFTVQ